LHTRYTKIYVEIFKTSILSKNINQENVHSRHPRGRLCLLPKDTSPTLYTCYKNEQGEPKDFCFSNSGLMFLLTPIHPALTKPPTRRMSVGPELCSPTPLHPYQFSAILLPPSLHPTASFYYHSPRQGICKNQLLSPAQPADLVVVFQHLSVFPGL